ncbi:hypothetical protein SLA2020_128950 [Shorea laevis]
MGFCFWVFYLILSLGFFADLSSSSLLLPLFNLMVAAASPVVNPQVEGITPFSLSMEDYFCSISFCKEVVTAISQSEYSLYEILASITHEVDGHIEGAELQSLLLVSQDSSVWWKEITEGQIECKYKDFTSKITACSHLYAKNKIFTEFYTILKDHEEQISFVHLFLNTKHRYGNVALVSNMASRSRK